MTAFRESQVIIIDTDRTLIKAGLGLFELLKAPTVELAARVGLRKHATASNGTSTPLVNGSTSKAQADVRTNGHSGRVAAKVSDYLVGSALDEALANGEDVEVSWPFEKGGVEDWMQAEALWRHVLFNKLSIRRTHNESPVLLTFPSSSSRRLHELITQLFFERLNVAALSIIQRPLAQLYAANSVSGVVIDINASTTDITPIIDTMIQHNSKTVLDIGYRDCETFLANLLRGNQGIIKAISPPDSPLSEEELMKTLEAIAGHVWKSNLIRIPLEGEAALAAEDDGVTDMAAVLVAGKEKAIIEAGLKKKASAKANAAERERAREIEALDLVQTQFGDLTLTLGKERHRFCDPLFDALLHARLRGTSPSSTLSIQEAVHFAVRGIDVDYRGRAWEGVFVTGEIVSKVKGIGLALQSYLSLYILSNIDSVSDVQPKSIRLLKVPEYFANFRERGDSMAAFLGASIVAKALFSDPASQTFVSKADYARIGPRAIVELVPTVL